MTEAEWQSGRDAKALVGHLAHRRKNRPGDRKLHLVMCAACRLVWGDLADPEARGVEAVERFADGLATAEEVRRADEAIHRSGGAGPARAAADWSTWGPWHDRDSLTAAARKVLAFVSRAAGRRRAAALAPLVRCVIGNPFRPVTFDPAWLTSTATALASQMYDSHDFCPMPILADALQDSGCTNEDVLSHCRGAGPHVRGCWVVDLVLGKA
jgi:hypothetical protein